MWKVGCGQDIIVRDDEPGLSMSAGQGMLGQRRS